MSRADVDVSYANKCHRNVEGIFRNKLWLDVVGKEANKLHMEWLP